MPPMVPERNQVVEEAGRENVHQNTCPRNSPVGRQISMITITENATAGL